MVGGPRAQRLTLDLGKSHLNVIQRVMVTHHEVVILKNHVPAKLLMVDTPRGQLGHEAAACAALSRSVKAVYVHNNANFERTITRE